MQIVIDIPQEAYKIIKKDTESEMYIIQVIKQGIPLDDIKAEIRQVVEEEADDERWSRGLHYALKIIDRHTGKGTE